MFSEGLDGHDLLKTQTGEEVKTSNTHCSICNAHTHHTTQVSIVVVVLFTLCVRLSLNTQYP